MTKEEENTKECLAWIEKSTLSTEEKGFCVAEVEKGGVFLAYGTLCRYQEGSSQYSSGTFSLWGSIIEW